MSWKFSLLPMRLSLRTKLRKRAFINILEILPVGIFGRLYLGEPNGIF
jgi:hypothetical protein